MSRSRVNPLILIVGLLVLGLAAKLIFHGSGHEAPPQPPLTRQAAASDPPKPTGGEHASVKLDLLQYGASRGSASRQPVGPSVIGTDEPDAARLYHEAGAALEAIEKAEQQHAGAAEVQAAADRAAQLAHEGLVHDPDFPQLLVFAAIAELRRGDSQLREAERLARRAAELAPMYDMAHYNLACVLGRRGLATEAAAELELTDTWFHGSRQQLLDEVAAERDFDAVRGSTEFAKWRAKP